MRFPLKCAAMLLPGLVVALALGGCGSPASPTKKAPNTEVSSTLEAEGYTGAITGTYVYDGTPEALKLLFLDEKKSPEDYKACHPGDPPAGIPGAGWYVNAANKGIKGVVVFLKAPDDADMPVKDEHTKALEKKNQLLRQPHCQFEPRISVLNPEQNLDVVNDSEVKIQHDAKLGGASEGQVTTLHKDTKSLTIKQNNDKPTSVSCAFHTGVMSGYIWKMTHPYLAVTDADGNFKIVGGPVVKGDKPVEIWVWHETFKDSKPRKIGDLKGAKKDEPLVLKDLKLKAE